MSGEIYRDRVLETTTSIGTTPVSLSGPVLGHQSFSAVGDTSYVFYCIYSVDGSGNANGAWEVGRGQYFLNSIEAFSVEAGVPYLTRDLILASSNANAIVNFGVGTKRVACVVPANRVANTPFVDQSNIFSIGGQQIVADGLTPLTLLGDNVLLDLRLEDNTPLVIFDSIIVDPSFDGTADPTSLHGQVFLGTSRNDSGWRIRTSRTYWDTGEDLQFQYINEGVPGASIVFSDPFFSTSSQTLTLHDPSYVALCLDSASNGSGEIFHTWNSTNSLGMSVSFSGPTRSGTAAFPAISFNDYNTTIPIPQDRTRFHVAGYGKGVGVGIASPFGLFDICGSTVGGSTFLSARSSTNVHREQVEFAPTWVVSTDATRKSRLVINVYDTAAREAICIEASGSAPMIGFLGASAIIRPSITGVRTGTLGQLQTVVANLLTALANLGLITDSTT